MNEVAGRLVRFGLARFEPDQGVAGLPLAAPQGLDVDRHFLPQVLFAGQRAPIADRGLQLLGPVQRAGQGHAHFGLNQLQ